MLDKTTLLYFPITSKRYNDLTVRVGSVQICSDQEVKCLGLSVNRHLFFSSHNNKQLERCILDFLLLGRLSPNMNTALLLAAYDALISPRLSYAVIICKSGRSARKHILSIANCSWYSQKSVLKIICQRASISNIPSIFQILIFF